VLELVDLSDRRYDLVSEFSGGMARRLEIARALMHVPRVLFLDEPTIGLDPQTRALMWEDVLRLREESNITVFLTTHYMDEAEYADRIAIIDHGRIVAIDTPQALKAQIGADTVDLRTTNDTVALAALERNGYKVQAGANGVRVFVEHGEAAVAPLVGGGRRAGPGRARARAHPRRRVHALHRPRDPRVPRRGHARGYARAYARQEALSMSTAALPTSLAITSTWRLPTGAP
jgi:ABC-type multidrug transport system ATPase subunit